MTSPPAWRVRPAAGGSSPQPGAVWFGVAAVLVLLVGGGRAVLLLHNGDPPGSAVRVLIHVARLTVRALDDDVKNRC